MYIYNITIVGIGKARESLHNHYRRADRVRRDWGLFLGTKNLARSENGIYYIL